MTRNAGREQAAGRVLVTGGGGFIGRHCLADLLERGFEVHAVSSRERDDVAGVTWHRLDLLRPGAAADVMSAVRPTHLLHLAWETTHQAFWRSPENLLWLTASIEMASAFAAVGGRRVVVAGTCAEYRWDDGVCSEADTPLEPRTLYGACKHALHVALDAYAAQVGMECAWGRIFFLFGPGETPERLVPSVARAMLRGEPAACSHGRQVRDFLYVEDAGRAFGALLASTITGAVNIASGVPVSVAEIARAIGDLTGRPELLRLGALPSVPDDPAHLVADVRRLRDEVGWRPACDLVGGLRATVESLSAAAPP